MKDEAGRARLRKGLLSALSHVYSDVLGGVERREVLLSGNGSLDVPHSSPLFAAVQKMRATAALNPYEREILYGYPYVIGRHDSESGTTSHRACPHRRTRRWVRREACR
jgi:hypothetical protein